MTEAHHPHNPTPDETPSTPPRASASGPTSSGPASASGEWIEVGEVVGTFGVHGELKVRPLTDFPDRFAPGATVFLGPERTPHTITSARITPDQCVLGLSGIDDMTAAQRLRGRRLAVPEAELASLPEGQFYLHDLIGLRVESTAGQPLGTVVDVITSAAQDLFVVRDPASQRETLVPAVKAFIKAIDLTQGVVRIEPIPGLFTNTDENAG